MSYSHEECAKCQATLTVEIPKVACGNSCLECGRYGYSADQPSYLYLLTNKQLELHKIGIGTVGKDKNQLQQLIMAGWTVHGLWHGSDKKITFQWEEEIFKQLKVKFSITSSESLAFVGRWDRNWVESISTKAISLADLSRLISTVISSKVR